jgi:transposase
MYIHLKKGVIMLPLPNKERGLIIFHKNNGEKNADICKWLQVNIRTVSRIWRIYKDTDSFSARPQNSGRKPLVTQEQMDMVVKRIKKKPDITLADLIAEFSLGITEPSLCVRLSKLGFTLKKRRSLQQVKNAQMFKKSAKTGKKTKSRTLT